MLDAPAQQAPSEPGTVPPNGTDGSRGADGAGAPPPAGDGSRPSLDALRAGGARVLEFESNSVLVVTIVLAIVIGVLRASTSSASRSARRRSTSTPASSRAATRRRSCSRSGSTARRLAGERLREHVILEAMNIGEVGAAA